MFRRAVCARLLARTPVLRGLKLRSALVDVLEPRMVGMRKWPSETSEGWPFPASCRGSGLPKCDGASRELNLAREVRGATQTARRLLDAENAELVRIIRAYLGSAVARDGYGARKSTRVSARRLVRRAPGVPDSSDQWPGVKAAGRPARVPPAEESQAEPCGNTGRPVVTLAARFGGVPEAPPGAVVPRAQEYPSCVADI